MAIFSFVNDLIQKRPDLKGRDWLGTVDEGKDHFRDIDLFIQNTGRRETTVFDIGGLHLFGYSYAKQTIRRVLLSGRRGEYEGRNFLIAAPNQRFCIEIEAALSEESLVMLGSTRTGKEFYSHYFLLGTDKPKMIEMLEIVIRAKEIMTSEVAKRLGITLQDASNWLKKLSDMRLIVKDKPVDRSGHVYTYRRVELE